jgi:hypothetical protein
MNVEVSAKLRIKHIDLYPKTTISSVRSCIYFSTILVQYAMEAASSTAHISDYVLVYSTW